VDTKSKFINTFIVTSASVHDSQATDDLLEEKDKDQELYADSAYTGKKQEETIAQYKMINKVHEKGYKNKPLTEKQKENNTEKSRTRARVEHVFGFMEQSMNGLKLKSIGIARATGIIGLINLTYNLFRYEQVVRSNISPDFYQKLGFRYHPTRCYRCGLPGFEIHFS
jgi:IS5 family transposase